MDQNVEYFEKYKSPDMLHSSLFPRYNVQIRKAYWATSQRRRTRLEELMCVIDFFQIWKMKSHKNPGAVLHNTL